VVGENVIGKETGIQEFCIPENVSKTGSVSIFK
jgi:hypothetical protein